MDDRWDAITGQILAALDIAAEYRELGVEIVGQNPSDNGWLPCRAIGRQDRRPSAAINVGNGNARGRYKDHAGDCENLSLFDFATKHGGGRFADWKAARKHFADKSGVKLPRGRAKSPTDEVVAFVNYSESAVRTWTKRKPPISPDAVRLAGARLANWPAKATYRFFVLAFPIYGEGLTDVGPVGHVLLSVRGENLMLYQGPTRDPLVAKVMMSKGSQPGFLNTFALERLAKAELVWKVEGITDMVALQTAIPAEYRDKHVVITNNAGAGQYPTPQMVAALRGHDVVLVHDCDKPGQGGIVKWMQALGADTKQLRNVVLPYPIVDDHGKDLRDYFAEGKTYADLLELLKKVTPVKAADVTAAAKSRDEEILEELDIVVLGLLPEDKMILYNPASKRNHRIDRLDQLGMGRISQICGEKSRKVIAQSKSELPASVVATLADLKNIIGRASHKVAMNMQTHEWLGKGCWWDDREQKIVLVDSACGYVWDGETVQPLETPRLGQRIYDFSYPDRWIDPVSLRQNLDSLQGQNAIDCFDELREVLSRWEWKRPEDATLAAAMMLCSWIQTLWDWRPQVAIVGPTNSGKSVFFEGIMHRFFGSMGNIYAKATQAGILQRISHSAIIMCLDELEHDSHRHSILNLLRVSSRGGTITKGTPDQVGKTYTLRHIFWTAAIEVGLTREPDKNRFITLNTSHHAGANNLKLPSPVDIQALGARCFAVVLRHAYQAIRLHKVLKTLPIEGVPSRHVESFAVPAAMLAAIRGESEQEAVVTLRSLVGDRFQDTAHQHDEEELVKDILSSHVGIGGGRVKTVTEIISDGHTYQAHRLDLERHGITLKASSTGPRSYESCDRIFIYPKEANRYLLKNQTRWAQGMDLVTILLRVPGARQSQVALHGSRVYGVEMPLASIYGQHSPTEEAGDEQDIEP